MKTFILSGGTIEYPVLEQFLRKEKPDCIITADKGLKFADAHGIMPDYIVGDFDSLIPAEVTSSQTHNAALLQKYRDMGTVPIDTFQPEKDMTDTDIALEKAIAVGATEVWFFGATGTRLDHTLSNIYDLYKLYQRGITGVIVDAHNKITMPVSHEIRIAREKQYGGFVSLFPFRGDVKNLTLRGMKYPLTGHQLTLGDGGLTVSNEIVEDEGVVTWEDGILILMETRD